MRRLDCAALSRDLAVRELTAAESGAVFALYETNPQYFRYCGSPALPETAARDMASLPPGVDREQKYFLGYYDGGELLAVLDLIDGYPDAGTAFLGLFMVRGDRAGQGLGTRLMEELFASLASAGFLRVRLAFAAENPQAARFWAKNGFVVLRRVPHEYGEMSVAERPLTV